MRVCVRRNSCNIGRCRCRCRSRAGRLSVVVRSQNACYVVFVRRRRRRPGTCKIHKKPRHFTRRRRRCRRRTPNTTVDEGFPRARGASASACVYVLCCWCGAQCILCAVVVVVATCGSCVRAGFTSRLLVRACVRACLHSASTDHAVITTAIIIVVVITVAHVEHHTHSARSRQTTTIFTRARMRIIILIWSTVSHTRHTLAYFYDERASTRVDNMQNATRTAVRT